MNTLTETQVRLFASFKSWIEGEAVRQLYATAKLDGVRQAVCFPDLHPGKGSPVGAAFVTDGKIYPHLIGGDIGCGMALFKTDLVRRDAKLDRWAEKYFHLEHPWDEEVGEFLAEHDLKSTTFDSALGTIGGGNHFAELQMVEQVLDAGSFKQLDLGKQQLVVLVHSGSRGLGETVLRAHVDQHFGNGVEAGSFAAEEYLRGHDYALRWAKANRELIARRFVATVGAEAESVWDGCHNSITRRESEGDVVWLHRKGAVDAESDFVVIPGSRGSMSYIVKPTGDGQSHAWSLAHGAGRKWARSDARQRMRERFPTSESHEGVQQTFGGDELFRDELKHFYESEDREELHRILGQQYHVVVGNPPYIVVKDKALNEAYRNRFDSCHGKYSLAAPFMERFFDLALKGDGKGQEWNARSEVGNEAVQHKRAQEGKRYLEQVGESIDDTVKNLRDLLPPLESAVPHLDEAAQQWNSSETYRQLEATATAKFNALRTDLSALANRFESEAKGLLQTTTIQALEQSISQAETAFLAACEQRGLTPADVERIKEVDQQLRTKTVEKQNKQREMERLANEASGLAESLPVMHADWQAESTTRTTALTRLTEIINRSGQFITCEVLHQGSLTDFNERLWSKLTPDGRSRIGRCWDALGKECFKCFRAGMTQTSFWDFFNAWLNGTEVTELASRNDLREEIKIHLKIEEYTARWEGFRTTRIADWLDFTLHRRDGTRAGSISDGQLSDGQRNTIVLSLLLADGNAPIVVDQPEDELDSDFIFNELVPVVRACKGNRQIVFVTHNANLPVNADADLVYALEFRGGKGRPLAVGGLDLPDVSKAVLNIMEGSRDAFERRREKYHF